MNVDSFQIEVPQKLIDVFSGPARYRCAYGGRGSAKTRTFALMAAIWGYRAGGRGEFGKILCGREFQNSLEDSSLEEVKIGIRSHDWLNDYYDVGQHYIQSKDGRIQFMFVGLRRSLAAITSKANILVAWVDEAEQAGDRAWTKLIPTIRKDQSEIWATWNPESKESATNLRFRVDPPPRLKIAEVNWRDNPWFPDVLDQERLHDLEKRPELYNHIWEGKFLEYVDGSYYRKELASLEREGRITWVSYDNTLPVYTAWDLGMDDATSIWFAQVTGQEVRIIDYYESSGENLAHYAEILQSKKYIYGTHILPHDVEVRELGTGKSRLDVLKSLGFHNIQKAPRLPPPDGRAAVRSFLGKCWFDIDKCEYGLSCLRQHHREYREATRSWSSQPKKDWSSHGADAFRYLATTPLAPSEWMTWEQQIRVNAPVP